MVSKKLPVDADTTSSEPHQSTEVNKHRLTKQSMVIITVHQISTEKI